MKKLSLLIFYDDYQTFIDSLREKGMVHIHENKARSEKDELLIHKLSTVKLLNDMIQRLKMRGITEQIAQIDVEEEQLEEHLRKQYHNLDHLLQQSVNIQKEIDLYKPWGDFSEATIEQLKEAGCEIRFYSTTEQKYQLEWENVHNAVQINIYKGQVYFVTVNDEEDSIKDAEIYQFPLEPRLTLLRKFNETKLQIEDIQHYLDKITVDAITHLEHQCEKIYETTDEINVRNASDAIIDGKIISLEGWCPVNRREELEEFLESKNVFFEIKGSTKEDDVPVLLKNNKFSRLFEPIGAMYDIPNYSELDLTPFFAPFFMLFFGLCMGDGGYGLLIWLVSFLCMRKVVPAIKPYLKLGEYLGIATMIVGILTGSFFGISLDSVTWSWLQGVKGYFITQANYGKYLGGYNPMMFFAFAIGLIQILFGMGLKIAKIIKQHGFKYALSEIGWLLLIIALLVNYGLPYLGVALSLFFTYLLYGIIAISIIAIFLLNSPDKNIFVNIGAGIWNSYNMATGLLGDILSYVRLFALGLTGSILGGVFNMIAIDMTADLNVVTKFIVMFLILIVGHTLNFAIAMIGALVHPMRLTFVEFYKSAGFEGMGKKYSPFKKRI
ncbi:MAG: ATPase [Culturomica sp.]|nr:ATPase [Culturomica sp.]